MSACCLRWWNVLGCVLSLILTAGCDRPPAAKAPELAPPTVAIGEKELLPIVVRRAFNVPPPRTLVKPTGWWIAVDVEVQPEHSPQGLVFDDLELLDGATGDSYGSAATLQRLAPDGKPADEHDTVFDGLHNYRCLAIYRAPRPCRTIQLRHEHGALIERPIPVDPAGPALPDPFEEPVAVVARGKLSADEDGYLVVLSCSDWPRLKAPEGVELRCVTKTGTAQAPCRAYAEVDEQNHLLKADAMTQPYYVPKRWFVLDFRCPRGSSVVDINLAGRSKALPSPSPLELPAETLAAIKG